MRHTRSIEARLYLLAFLGSSAVAGVAVTGFLSVSDVADQGLGAARAQTVLSVQQDAQAAAESLRGDVLAAFAIPGDRAVGQVTTTHDAEKLRAALAANASQVALFHDRSLDERYVRTAEHLVLSATMAEQLVTSVSSDPASARRGLAAFLSGHEAGDREMAALTAQLSARADAARAASARARRQGPLHSVQVAVLALVFPVGLCLAITRSVRSTLRAKAAAECAAQEANEQLTQDATRERFDATLKDAFDMAVSESEAHSVVRRAVLQTVPGHRAELLLADNSRAHLTRAMTEPGDNAPGCGVLTPSECIAVRRGRPVAFDSADGIGSCPKLVERGIEIGHAACSPVTFLGEGLGVLHVISGPGQQLDPGALRSLAVTAEQAGNRIGTLRAFARSQLQANTDGLTGLLNRRTAEEKVGELQRAGRSVALALCDLDHFKQINDTFGHEAGDRALRVFSATLRSVMRSQDIVARYGGEEFLLVMPDCAAGAAEEVLGRIQTELALTLQAGGAPSFTASFGLTIAESHQPLDEIVRKADAALLQAKADGRDRVVCAAVPAARQSSSAE